MSGTFINLTNHPSSLWSKEQLDMARQYGDIIDMPFPIVDPDAGPAEIDMIADACVEKIRAFEEPTALVQGESTLAFDIVARLNMEGIKTLAACSERQVVESKSEDGTAIRKSVIFRFRRFREYILALERGRIRQKSGDWKMRKKSV